MVADDPQSSIDLKIFHAKIRNEVDQLKIEEASYKDIPVIRKISEQEILDNYMQVKLDVELIIEQEMENLRTLRKKIAGK